MTGKLAISKCCFAATKVIQLNLRRTRSSGLLAMSDKFDISETTIERFVFSGEEHWF